MVVCGFFFDHPDCSAKPSRFRAVLVRAIQFSASQRLNNIWDPVCLNENPTFGRGLQLGAHHAMHCWDYTVPPDYSLPDNVKRLTFQYHRRRFSAQQGVRVCGLRRESQQIRLRIAPPHVMSRSRPNRRSSPPSTIVRTATGEAGCQL